MKCALWWIRLRARWSWSWRDFDGGGIGAGSGVPVWTDGYERALCFAVGAVVVLGALWIGFLVLGGLAVLLAGVGAEVAAWGLQIVFSMSWTPTPVMWALGPALSALIVGGLGVWSCRRVVNDPPVVILRRSERHPGSLMSRPQLWERPSPEGGLLHHALLSAPARWRPSSLC